MKILIIEDEVILLKVLTDKFKADGWSVVGAKDGEEGLDAIRQESFDVVLLDLLLPRKDGFQILREVKVDPKYKALPILVISNLGSEDDISMAMNLGATDYLIKTRHSLKEIIDKAGSFVKG